MLHELLFSSPRPIWYFVSIMDTIPADRHESSPPAAKLAALDAIRSGAAIGVVLLHACVPYLRNPMPGLAWPVRDAASLTADLVCWTIELFIMPLFLVVAGYLAWQSLERRGAGPLVRNRAKRLLIPLLFGCVVILPIDLHVWVLGWVVDGFVEPVKLKSFKFDGVIDRDLWGTGHLWFLQYLFLYVVGAATWSVARQKFVIVARFRLGIQAIAIGIFAIAVTVCWIQPGVVWGFQHSFWPVPSKWIYCGMFFIAGSLLATYDPRFEWLKTNFARLAASAGLAATAAVIIGRMHLADGNDALVKILLAPVTVAAASAITLAIIAGASKYVRRVSLPIQYLAAASFWVYLVHHPIVGLVHIDLKLLIPGVSPTSKLAISFLISVGVSLLTYEGLIRKTALGRLLGFAWSIPKPAGEIQSPSADTGGDVHLAA